MQANFLVKKFILLYVRISHVINFSLMKFLMCRFFGTLRGCKLIEVVLLLRCTEKVGDNYVFIQQKE